MKFTSLPRYVRTTRAARGFKDVKKGEVFDTNQECNFSKFNWNQILLGQDGIDNWIGYFEEISEKEYCNVKGIKEMYEIY